MTPITEAELLTEIEQLRKRISELESRADRNQHAHQNLQQIEWMLADKKPERADYVPGYGDLSLLNQDGLILTTVGRELLRNIASEYLDLLETSAAIYERDGNYALGLFSSGWCQMMDAASRRLCGTDDNQDALQSGKWLCHESCWKNASLQSMEKGKAVDIECSGGIRLYAVPVYAGNEIVGSINFGYGDPPRDENKLGALSRQYQLPLADLRKQARAYQSRPQFVIDYAKTRLEKAATYLGAMIEREQAVRAMHASEQQLLAANQQLAAGNQQLRATEQQLRASNQQLTASLQQLQVSEQQVRDNETRLQSLVRILQHESPSVQAFLDYALDEAIQLTESRIGYIYFYNEKNREFTLNTWSRGVMDVCAVTKPQTVYQLENTGIWGEAVRRRKEILVNDFRAPHPLKKGFPEGHAPLNKFLTVPVFSRKKIVAVVGVANKETDYDQSDVLQLRLLMDGVWKETDRILRETTLRQEKEWSQKIIDNAPNIILGLQENSKIVVFNRFAERLTGYTAQEVVGKEWISTFIPEEKRKTFYRLWNEIVDNQLMDHQFENEIVTKSGELRLIKWHNTVLTENNEFRMILSVGEDITERKKTEKALQESEAMFRNLFKKHTAVKLLVEPSDGRILDANEAAATFYGWSLNELRKMKVMDINTLSPQEVKAEMENAWTGKRTFFEFKHRRADGSVRDVVVYSSRIESAGEYLLHSIIHDITEQKNAKKELETNYALLRIAGQTARFGGWNVDLSTNTMTWSDAVADIHEMPRGYALAVSDGIQFYAPEWQERIQQVFTDCIQKGTPYDERMEIITRTGKRVWVRTTGEAVRDEAGHIIKVQGSFQDITKSKKNYDALQQANEQLQKNYRATRRILEDLKAEVQARESREAELQKVTLAVEQAGEEVVITDPAGTIQYVNPAFETVTGYSRTEVLGRNPRLLKSGEQDETFYRDLWTRITHGQTWQGRMVNKRKDGKRYTEEATISPMFDAAGNIINFVAVKRDITAQLELSAQFQQAQKMESVGRLAGGVAHDYNNMLSVIIGYTQLAMAKVDASDPLYADLKEIYQAAQRSTEITRKLLAFARKQTISPEVLDLNTAVEGMLKMLRRLLQEDLTLSWHPGADVWPISIDPSQVDQILMNLCVNARDAIEGSGEIIIETKNRVLDSDYCELHKGFLPGEFVMLAVSDNGCGMDKNTLEHIFEPFYTTKQKGQGTGLGLPMVYGIVKQNNGFINVYSEPDHGTTIKIYFPCDKTDLDEVILPDSQQPETGRGETILVVEDEPALLAMATRLLESLKYNVLGTSSASEALQMAEKHAGKFHLLLTDVIMPEMNGRELADRLTTVYPDLKTLFMSGYTANVIAHQGILDKGMHFIQKPLSINELAKNVQQVLGNKK